MFDDDTEEDDVAEPWQSPDDDGGWGPSRECDDEDDTVDLMDDDDPPDEHDEREGARQVLAARRRLACESCRFWAAGDMNGECRRRAPEITDEDGNGIWPVTEPDEWCGEYDECRPESPRGAARSRA